MIVKGIKITPNMIGNGEFILTDEERRETEEELRNGTFWEFECDKKEVK